MRGRPCSSISRPSRSPPRRPDSAPFRMAVQWVNRPDSDFRGYAGRIAERNASGRATQIVILPSGRRSHVERIVTFDGDLERAVEGQSVTLTLADEVDCSRGDVIAAASAPPQVADAPRRQPRLDGGRAARAGPLLLAEDRRQPRLGDGRARSSISSRSTAGRPAAARPLALNDIGRCEIGLDRAVAGAPLCPRPRARRLHPDRQAQPCHRRGRDDRRLPAPRRPRPLGRRVGPDRLAQRHRPAKSAPRSPPRRSRSFRRWAG